jgi:hypothetical protein
MNTPYTPTSTDIHGAPTGVEYERVWDALAEVFADPGESAYAWVENGGVFARQHVNGKIYRVITVQNHLEAIEACQDWSDASA